MRAFEDLDVNSVDDESKLTPLFVAAEHGNVRTISALLSLGADASAVCSATGDTPLHFAARQGGSAAIGRLRAEGADISARNVAGETPLLVAAAAGNLDSVQAILNLCADTVSWWCDRCTATHTSKQPCGMGIKMTADSFIPKENAKSLHIADKNGTTPAMAAAGGSHAAVLAVLVQDATFPAAGGIGAQDKDGRTALHYAARQASDDCLQVLFRLPDAPHKTKDKQKMTAGDIAASTGGAVAAAMKAFSTAADSRSDALLRELLGEEESQNTKSKQKKKKRKPSAAASEPAAAAAAEPEQEEEEAHLSDARFLCWLG